MNATLMAAFARQRLASPLRLVLLGAAFLFPLLFATFAASLSPLQHGASFFALILAAGAIGQEVSSGVLQLTFARPVSRRSYVLSRWGAATLLATAAGALQVALAVVFIGLRGGAPGVAEPLLLILEDLLVAGAAAAVMVALSSVLDGLGDVGVYVLAQIVLAIAQKGAELRGWTIASRAIEECLDTLKPHVSLAWLAGHGSPDPYGLVTVLSTVALGLALAVLAVNRKELSYAAG